MSVAILTTSQRHTFKKQFFSTTSFRSSWELTCSSVSADGRFRGFLMRDILTKLWKATDLQTENIYRHWTKIQCHNMLHRITNSKTTYHLVLSFSFGGWKLLLDINISALKTGARGIDEKIISWFRLAQ